MQLLDRGFRSLLVAKLLCYVFFTGTVRTDHIGPVRSAIGSGKSRRYSTPSAKLRVPVKKILRHLRVN